MSAGASPAGLRFAAGESYRVATALPAARTGDECNLARESSHQASSLTLRADGEERANIIAVDTTAHVDTVAYPLANAADLAETARRVEATGQGCIAVDADVRDADTLSKVVDAGVAEFGRLNIVLANADILSLSPTLELSERAWQAMIDINLTGVWKTIKVSVPHIIRVIRGERGGAVVITSSLAAMQANENTAHYSAKAGQVMLMKVLVKSLHRIAFGSTRSIRRLWPPTCVSTKRPIGYSDQISNIQPAPTSRWPLAHLNRLPVATLDVSDVTNAVV
jgi:NAD(P)-dependent dehydrogenase (short-subunit alcohol dehydrogenase family)